MATLERIRQRSGLLLIVIGLAMAAFILTDLLGQGRSLLRGEANLIGEVNGESIDSREFNDRVQERLALLQQQNQQQAANFTNTAVASQIWNEFQEEVLLTNTYPDLGIGVTNTELFERISENPQVRQLQFARDQVTGQFSPQGLKDFISRLRESAQTSNQPEAREEYVRWLNFEDGTRKQVTSDKYLYAVRKGLYMPTTLAKADYDRRNQNLSVQFFGMEYSTIPDSTIEVSDSELEAYYRDHKESYKSDNTREIAFVNFSVVASLKDRSAIVKELESYLKEEVFVRNGISDTLPSFYDTDDDSTFAVGRSDLPVSPAYRLKESFTAPYDSIFFSNEVGYIHGPYEQNGTFKLSKITDIAEEPDSATVRHILISYQGANNGQSQATRAPQEAKNLADSLIEVVRADTSQFAALAAQYSDDPGSKANGGVYDWFTPGTMVPSFNNFSFYREIGDIGMVYTQFGIHIIEVLDKRGANKVVKLIDIVRNIEASEATGDSIYNLATNFASLINDTNDFAELAASMGYSARPAGGIEPMQESILGIGSNREIVKWIHNDNTELGDIQLHNNQNNSYVVTQVTLIRPDDYLPLDLVEDQVRAEVIKQKKAAQLKEQLEAKLGPNADISAIATDFDKQLQTQSVNFGTANLTGYGSEPLVVGQATGLNQGQLSKVIEGDRGVYVVFIQSSSAPAELSGYESEQIRLETAMSNAAAVQVIESLKESAEVENYLKNFY